MPVVKEGIGRSIKSGLDLEQSSGFQEFSAGLSFARDTGLRLPMHGSNQVALVKSMVVFVQGVFSIYRWVGAVNSLNNRERS